MKQMIINGLSSAKLALCWFEDRAIAVNWSLPQLFLGNEVPRTV